MTKDQATAKDDDARHNIGGNNPPEPLSIGEQLADANDADVKEMEALQEKFKKLPKKVKKDEHVGTITDFANDMKSLGNRMEAKRKLAQEPILKLSRETNAFFYLFTKPAEEMVDDLRKRCDEFLKAKAEKNRLEEAKRAEEAERNEADRLAKAQALADDGSTLRAKIAENEARDASGEKEEKTNSALSAPASQFSKTTSEGGGTASTRGTWTFSYDDIDEVDLEAIRPFLKPDDIDKAIRAFVKMNKDKKKLKGVKIFQEQKTTFRA